jgi:hypothetical protein
MSTKSKKEEEDLKEQIAKAEILLPEKKAKPRVYYIGKPKRFTAADGFSAGSNRSIYIFELYQWSR